MTFNIARANGRMAALRGQPRSCVGYSQQYRRDWLAGWDSVPVDRRGAFKDAT